MRASAVQPVPAQFKEVHSAKFLSVVHRRKQADNDIQLLANRIQMLKKEENKALKKIENTTQRASHILQLREENERRLKDRLRILQLEKVEVEKARQANLALEERSRHATQRRIQCMNQRRQQDVKEVRKEKRAAKEDATLQRAMELVRKKEQRAAIKASEEEARRIREISRVKRQEIARMNYEQRIRKEEEEVGRREAEVAAMEKMEMELIQQLKNTQMRQKVALEELESALRIEGCLETAAGPGADGRSNNRYQMESYSASFYGSLS